MFQLAKLARIKTESLRNQVYAQLKTRLLEGAWKPGEKIPSESQLCEQFGVSRVTVRAAIQQLEILGLLETRHGGGSYVRAPSSIDALDTLHPSMVIGKGKDLIMVQEYRQIIEKGAIGIAAARRTEADLEYLEGTYARMVEAYDVRDRIAFSKADHDFHHRLALITRNPIVIKVYALLDDILSETTTDIVALIGYDIGLRYHRKIIDALKTGDPQESEAAMAAHIGETILAIAGGQRGSRADFGPRS